MEVKVLLDSLNPYNSTRLTTLYCIYPQNIHQQVLTHRMFSRNSSSLRAISYNRLKDWDIVYPTWTLEKKGMQGEVVTDQVTIECANATVDRMFSDVLHACETLKALGIHHQNINDFLRPFTEVHTVITATDFDNFFEQRLHESTKPDMQQLAQMMKEALANSVPESRYIHIPIVEDLHDDYYFNARQQCLVSAARLARISYFKWQDDPYKDIELAYKLIKDKHPSPFEHQAYAMPDKNYYANFRAWEQFRKRLFI